MGSMGPIGQYPSVFVTFPVTPICPYPPAFRHINIIAKILADTAVIPAVDANSHRDVWIAINAALFLGISKDVIVRGFQGWTSHPAWTKLWHPEYMYLLYTISEELIDLAKYMRVHANPMAGIDAASKLPELQCNPVTYIEALIFFEKFELSSCFESNDRNTRKQHLSLKKARAQSTQAFLVNPHSPFLRDYFVYSPISGDIWDCKGISIVQASIHGEPVIASAEESLARFAQFTCGVFEKSPNHEVARAGKAFPHANVVFAGGSITKLVAKEYNSDHARQSDVDMFVIANSFAEQSRLFREIIAWFTSPGTYFAISGSVTTVYIEGVARKFQIITSDNLSPIGVISRFDLTHIQWCLHQGVFYGTPDACKALREKVTRFNNIVRIKMNRLVKALYCGYSIYRDQTIMNDIIDITELIADTSSAAMAKMIRSFNGWWYPVGLSGFNSVDSKKQYILCQIEQDSNATMVTDDPAFVLSNTIIGGSFDTTYISAMFNTFNAAVIANPAVGRRIVQMTLRSKFGIIYLNSATMKVQGITHSDIGIEIIAGGISEEFKRFTEQLEGQILRSYRAGGDPVRRLVIDSKMTILIPRIKLDMCSLKEKSCLRSQRGESLNIDEDLREGDDFQMQFTIDLLLSDDLRGVHLNPVRFIKYQPLDVDSILAHTEEFENVPEHVERIDCSSAVKYEKIDI